MVIDTLSDGPVPSKPSENRERDQLVGTLLGEVQSLKGMLSDVAKVIEQQRGLAAPLETQGVNALEGSWRNERGTHYYAKVVRGELVVPYCYQGNENLTGVFFDWRKMGEHWFAKFAWLTETISGFCFLKQESLGELVGAWWYENEVASLPSAPPTGSGVAVRWHRLVDQETPAWARLFVDEVQDHGLLSRLTRR